MLYQTSGLMNDKLYERASDDILMFSSHYYAKMDP